MIRASSIIPAYGNHPDNKAIHPSNKHLKTACDKEKTLFIDNTPSFVTKRGAPKQAHYWDTYHPSDEGTAKLAVNLKYAGRETNLRPREHHGPSQRYYPRSVICKETPL
nr:hypothetical protein BaRGS_019932 [Batillaria attramentaria]